MKAAVVHAFGQPLQIEEIPVPEPGIHQVLVKVIASGVCHTDLHAVSGDWPVKPKMPLVPGHEAVGYVAAIGPEVTHLKEGDIVVVPWLYSACGCCEYCITGWETLCEEQQNGGYSVDGGYAEYVVAPAEAVAAIPDDLSSPDAAPLMCAGITTYNSLRNSPARAGDLIAIQGIGGLGHLGIQFARQMGFRTVALGRGAGVEALAKKLGAHHYIDTTTGSPAEALQKLGGARLVMSTAPDAKSVPVLIDGLVKGGELLLLGVPPEPFIVSAAAIVVVRRNIQGWPSGTAKDSEDTLQFCSMTGVRAMIEKFPLEKAAEAYDHMLSGRVQFRAVLTMN